MSSKVLLACILMLLAATLLAGCGVPGTQRNPSTITIEDAAQVLEQVQGAAATGDMNALCATSDAPERCETDWAMSGGADAVPSEPPTIVTSRVLPTRQLPDGDWEIGGRMLVLKGIDGLGRPYCTDFLVFAPSGQRLTPFQPVYWSGMGIAQRGPSGEETSNNPRPWCEQ
jgi:hypothetical protein